MFLPIKNRVFVFHYDAIMILTLKRFSGRFEDVYRSPDASIKLKTEEVQSSFDDVCRSFEDSLEVVLETPCVLTLLGHNKGFKTSLKGPFLGLLEDDFCTTFAHWVGALLKHICCTIGKLPAQLQSE